MPIRKTASILLLATVFVAEAAPNSPSTGGPVALVIPGDPFAEEAHRTQSWLVFPGTNVAGWQLSLRMSTNRFQRGKPIAAVVVFANVSTNSLRLYVSTPGVPYMFSTTVLDASNRLVPMNDEAREHIEHGRADLGLFRDVPPATTLAFPVELEHLYHFGLSGAYKIQATARWLTSDAHWVPGAVTATATTGFAPFQLLDPP